MSGKTTSITTVEEALKILSNSLAVQKARVSMRGSFQLLDQMTGELSTIEGPALIFVISESMVNQGW